MQRLLPVLFGVLACAGFLPAQSRADGSAPAQTPPPQIYHIVTTALCARLHETVRPAVAMVLQNDGTIAKSPPLFKRYARAVADVAGAPSGPYGDPNTSESIYNQSPETSMTLQQMSYLVLPTARNLISSQTLLDDPKFTNTTGSSSDDAALAQIRKQLLQTIALQSASLDLINGFVQTMQMGEIQHAGEEYLGAIQGSDTVGQPISATPNPWQDPNTPGITPNPYSLDVSQIPGLSVGYNPISHVVDGLAWLQSETTKSEDAAAKSISAALSQCPK